MIRVEQKDKHKTECDSCTGSVDLKTIRLGPDLTKNSICITLCADCRRKLMKGIDKTFDSDFQACDGCDTSTHLDDLQSCWDCGQGDNNTEWYCSKCLVDSLCKECRYASKKLV